MSPRTPRLSVGGDFELTNIPQGTPERLTPLTQGFSGSWTLSGRSALALVLQDFIAKGVSHIQLPAYLCDSVLAPIEALDLAYSFYPVDRGLAGQPTASADSAVLVINYFGWQNPALENLSDGVFLIEDSCQALLSVWSTSRSDSKRIIFSPRKFGPTALGGWCNISNLDLPSTTAAESALRQALDARLLRGKYLSEINSPIDPEIENKYLASLAAVEEFLDANPKEAGLPELGLKVIAGIDWQMVATRRRSNWQHLRGLLSERVEIVFDTLPDSVVPLGFVIRTHNRDRVRATLASKRIYCPVHWPLPKQVSRSEFPVSAELADTLLTLPIDQRYTEDDMIHLARAVNEAVEDYR